MQIADARPQAVGKRVDAIDRPKLEDENLFHYPASSGLIEYERSEFLLSDRYSGLTLPLDNSLLRRYDAAWYTVGLTTKRVPWSDRVPQKYHLRKKKRVK